MHDVHSIRALIVDAIQHIYECPQMYGPLAEHADTMLTTLH